MASFFSPPTFFLKCSVSCGTGVQVRKVECVSTTMAMAMPQQQQQLTPNSTSSNGNAQNTDYYLSDNVSGNNNNDDDNERRVSNGASETLQANGNVANRNTDGQTAPAANGQHLQCDTKTKPIATQPCTTGIECSPITLGTGNIDRGRGVDDDAEQIERTKVVDTADTDADDTEAIDTNANAENEPEETDGSAEAGGEAGEREEDAEEMEEIEVFSLVFESSISDVICLLCITSGHTYGYSFRASNL